MEQPVGQALEPAVSPNLPRKVNMKLVDLVSVDTCISLAAKMDFEIFEDKLNIWGIRVPKGNDFNDVFHIFYKQVDLAHPDGVWKSIITYGTTEPAAGYLATLVAQGGKNPNGIAILLADKQYIDCWVAGTHKGKYFALDQIYNFKFQCYRKKKDDILYYDGPIYTDAQGIQFHTTKVGYLTNAIVGFSEECQVIFDATLYFNGIVPVMQLYKDTKYSYTLVNSYQFFNL